MLLDRSLNLILIIVSVGNCENIMGYLIRRRRLKQWSRSIHKWIPWLFLCYNQKIQFAKIAVKRFNESSKFLRILHVQ